jgi:sugar phosphate isomerase/epimerase
MRYITLGYTAVYATPAETIDAASFAGFDSVGIRVTGRKPADPDLGVVGFPAAIADLKKRLDGGGLRLSNVSTYHFHPELRLDNLLPVLDATAELGASFMVASCYDTDEGRYVEKLAGCCEAAARLNIRVALEFIPYSAAPTISQARHLVRKTGQSNAGILVDALHLDRSGGTPNDLAQIEPELIHFAQLCDAISERPSSTDDLRAEAIGGRLYPGHGALPLHDFMDALPPDTEIECETPNSALKDISANERATRAGVALRLFLEHNKTRLMRS